MHVTSHALNLTTSVPISRAARLGVMSLSPVSWRQKNDQLKDVADKGQASFHNVKKSSKLFFLQILDHLSVTTRILFRIETTDYDHQLKIKEKN